MGADMVLGMIAHKVGTVPTIEPALAYISTLKLEDFTSRTCILTGADGENIADCTTHEHDTSEPEALHYIDTNVSTGVYNEDGDLTPEGVEYAKTALAELIGQVFESMDSRDVTSMRICGWWCYFSGGMSWGDTEESNALWSQLTQDWGIVGEKVYLAAGFDWPPMEAG